MKAHEFVRRLGGALAAAALGLAGLTACQAGGSDPTAVVNCDNYQIGDGSSSATAYPLLLVMLDVSDNSALTGNRIGAKLRPYLDSALAGGAYVRVVTSGGENTSLDYSPCFSGQYIFKIDRRNATRQKKDRLSAGEALQTRVSELVQETRVVGTGSVTSLLADASHEIQTVRSTPGAKIGAVSVLVWTNLLGNTTGPDCLNVNGQQASPAIAEALVRRCFSTGTLTSLGSDQVRFLGVNDSAGTEPQQDISRYLESELCRRISSNCI